MLERSNIRGYILLLATTGSLIIVRYMVGISPTCWVRPPPLLLSFRRIFSVAHGASRDLKVWNKRRT